ncbi:MAG TPA: NUDIX pyrophosphatase [Armatimonadota bacterium]|jgi:8-oxo-dGTP pyrophosphatase MutT (NUDIX family)
MSSINTALVDVHVFCRESGRTLYLLLHRAPEKRYAGLWRMVAGKVEAGERPLHAALRELTEETGLTAQAVWSLDYLHTYYDPQQDTCNLIPVFAVEVASCQQLTLSEEHDASRWIMYEQAMEILRWPGQREGLRRTHEDIVTALDRGAAFSVALDA